MASRLRANGPDQDDVLELIELIYAAAEDATRWTAFLERLRDNVRGTVTAFVFDDLSVGRSNIAASVRMDPAFAHLYEQYFHAHNAWADAAGSRIRSGSVLTSQMILADRDLVKSEYYAGFLRPQDARHLLSSIPFRDERSFSQVSVLRPGRMPPFSDQDVALMRALIPHLQRGIRVHRHLTQLADRSRLAEELLDRVPFGAVLLGDDGKIVLVNRAAKEILDSHDGLRLTSNGLAACRSDETAALRRLITEATRERPGLHPESVGTMSISRLSLRRPYSVLVAPLRLEASRLGTSRAAVAAFLTDPEKRPRANCELLRKLYGFTPMESSVAARLLSGETPARAAESLNITLNTARTHIKNLHAKARTHRLSELVRTLAGGIASLRTP